MNNSIVDFSNKVANLISAVGITDRKEEVFKNLLSAHMITFSRLLSTDESITPYLKSFADDKNNKAEDLLKFLDSKGVDYQKYFLQAETETFNNFFAELEKTFSPDKIGELKALI